MRLTEHFTLEELTASDTAKAKKISNVPDTESAASLAILAAMVLEPARVAYGAPIRVTSGYRCARLNKAVGGVATSQHCKGQAADLQCADMPKLFDILAHMDIDQLLFEKNSAGVQWIHVSYNPEGNRHKINKNYIVK